MIQIQENFLPTDLAQTISSYSGALMHKTEPVFYTNYAWTSDSVESNKDRYERLVLIHDLKVGNPELNQQVCNAVNMQLDDYKVHNDTIFIYLWTNMSRIEWHNDSKTRSSRCGAVTVYLNQRWDLEWGGDFLYKDEDNEVHRISPSFNKGVFITDLEHRTTPVIGKKIRKTLQIWLEPKL